MSFSFALFLSIVLLTRLGVGTTKIETPYVVVLLCGSALFYAWHVPTLLGLLLTSAIVDFLAGFGLARQGGATEASATRRRWILLASLSVNLGLLFWFKYADLAVDGLNALSGVLGAPLELPHLGLILPMGISFYTFASLSYTLDVYFGVIPPVKSFWRFLLFISFFPHLVAGPIVRARMFLPQIDRPRRLCLKVFLAGAFLVIRGFFLKMVCANNLALLVNLYWNSGTKPGANAVNLCLMTVMFAAQIFYDFEGYTSIAQGLAYWLGYRLPDNFNNPYLAISFRNFWERWHITLSQWLRDYLYIPLGGSRGPKAQTCRNLLIVMVLGGLWHGAKLTFIAWGAVHGLALVVERLVDKSVSAGSKRRSWPCLRMLLVQVVVLVGWILFRSESLGDAMQFLSNFLFFRIDRPRQSLLDGLIFMLPILVMHLRGFMVERHLVSEAGFSERAVLAAFMLYLTLTCYGVSSVFIYFQF